VKVWNRKQEYGTYNEVGSTIDAGERLAAGARQLGRLDYRVAYPPVLLYCSLAKTLFSARASKRNMPLLDFR
jgi:hypothetical protein